MKNPKLSSTNTYNSGSLNNKYSSARDLIKRMENWLTDSLESSDILSKEQQSELLHEIERAKLNFYLFEQLILMKASKSITKPQNYHHAS